MIAAAALPISPVIEVFISQAADEAFSAFTQPGAVWLPDPLDVESIHAKARATFMRLLNRAAEATGTVSGKIFLLRGIAGSGKTHLMRAFRYETHAAGGYAGYLQMVSKSSDYTRYVLAKLIDSLDRDYRNTGDSRVTVDPANSGLVRLAQGLLDAIGAPASERAALAEAAPETGGPAKLVTRLADAAVGGKFDSSDLDLVRALLYLLAPDHRLKSRVMKWLLCEEMTPADRELIGGLPNYPAEAGPLRMIQGIGRVAAASQSAPLVLLADQLEETFDQDELGAEAGCRFRQAVDALVNIAAHVPNSVVVVACLDSLYGEMKEHLALPKLQRLENDTPPVTLEAKLVAAEVEAIVARRLGHLTPTAGPESLAPFRPDHLAHLAGQTIRSVLLFVHEHHRRCRDAGGWVEPTATPTPADTPVPPLKLAQMWNDFKASPQSPGLGDEPALAQLLAESIEAASDEFPEAIGFTADREERFVRVSVNVGGGGLRFVAVCDKGAQGGGLGRQVKEAVAKASGVPVVLVRSEDFPKGASLVAKDIAKLVKPVGSGLKVSVSDGDWRAMAAFRAFHAKHRGDSGFAAWQLAEKPLAGLPSLRAMLDLNALAAIGPATPPVTAPPAGVAKTLPPPAGGVARLGVSRGATASPVELPFADLCRHAAFLGGSGSGKTTAALAVVEQLLAAGVPAVLVDRKGDLARYADPDAWAEPEPDAARAARRAALRARLDIALYTPGSASGRPLAIPVVPDLAGLPKADQEQLAGYAAAALAGMMGYKDKPGDAKLVILQKAVEVAGRAATPGRPVTARGLQELVAEMDESLLAETAGFDAKHFKKLGEDLLTLAIGQRRLLEDGEPLDIDALLGRGLPAGKTRLAVVNTQSLGAAADFWVAQFLAAFDRWRAKSPATSLQAVLLLDEANVYLPAIGKPAAKAPLESLLRQGRSAGLGVFLATQSPGDLDYKGRDQILTWLLGRVKEPTALAKLRPMLERQPAALDKLAQQAAGEFHVVRECGVSQVRADRNLLPTAQLPAERVLALARGVK